MYYRVSCIPSCPFVSAAYVDVDQFEIKWFEEYEKFIDSYTVSIYAWMETKSLDYYSEVMEFNL